MFVNGLSTGNNRISRLAQLTGWEGVGVDLDWVEVERALGLPLPQEYKEYVRKFPRGFFNDYVQVITPDRYEGRLDLLGTFRMVLDNMREMRGDRPQEFPHPIYPELDGVIPWGNSPKGEYFYWVSSDSNPDKWCTAISGSGWHDWEVHSQSMVGLLAGLMTGEVESKLLQKDLNSGIPSFRPWQAR